MSAETCTDQLLAAPADSAEPTVQEAADLIRATAGLGTVARLDYVHAALCAAYARGDAIATARSEAHPWVLR